MRFAVLVFALGAIAADYPEPLKLPDQPKLPDPLVGLDHKPITSAQQWETLRKPELKQLFQHYMYGQYPSVKPNVSGKVLFEDKKAFEGIATLMEVELTMFDGAPPVYMLLMLPNNQTKPAPMFVGLSFVGNHVLTDHPKVRIPTGWMYKSKDNKAAESERGTSTRWPLKAIAEHGYGMATVYYGDIIPDDPNVEGGLKATLMPENRPDDASAAIMCWAWGLHRMVDYLETLDRVDAKRLAVVGHSRLGKTALVAMAFDDRFAVGIPNDSGCCGAAPSRTDVAIAEKFELINKVQPHWLDGNFKQFDNHGNKLPFDQHSLLALCAPRPMLYANAQQDPRANPEGQFEMMQAATPVYKLLGVEGMSAKEYPKVDVLVDSRLGYHVRPGKHDMTHHDWEVYMRFADKWMK